MVTATRSAGHWPARILLPKEHGAYGQLLFPMGTALLMGQSAAAFAMAAACAAAFVGHEAVLTLLGQRGARVARDRRRDAIFSLACCAAIAAPAGAWALWQMAPASRASVLVPGIFVVGLAPLIWRRREHTAAGEVLAALGLSSCGLPIARAAGVSNLRALTCWLVFALSFTVATVAVRSVIARIKNARLVSPAEAGSHIGRTGSAFWLAAAVFAASLVSASRGWVSAAAPLALLPVCGLAVGLLLFPPHPRRLRAVGWSLVGATAVTAVVLAVAA